MALAVKQKYKTIELLVVNIRRQKFNVSFHVSDLVEEILIAFNEHEHDVHPYHNGKRLLKGRLISDYELPHGARIDLRMFSQQLSTRQI